MTDIGLTTVLDQHPRFWSEFVLWLLCAERQAIAPRRVYVVGDVPAGLQELAEARGCELRRAEPLIPEAPHCNKLIPFLDPAGFSDQVVTDADLFVTGDIVRFFVDDAVRLAPNNHGNPPLAVWERVFTARGLAVRPEPGLSLLSPVGRTRETYRGNVSAGVICIPAQLRWFGEVWREHAEWLSSQADLLGRYRVHVDQVAFGIAAQASGVAFEFLPPQTNAVLGLLPQIDSVFGLHLTSGHIPEFPEWFASDGTLRLERIANPALAPALTEFNECVVEAMTIIESMPALRPFRSNFLAPSYLRDRAID